MYIYTHTRKKNLKESHLSSLSFQPKTHTSNANKSCECLSTCWRAALSFTHPPSPPLVVCLSLSDSKHMYRGALSTARCAADEIFLCSAKIPSKKLKPIRNAAPPIEAFFPYHTQPYERDPLHHRLFCLPIYPRRIWMYLLMYSPFTIACAFRTRCFVWGGYDL